MGANLGGANLKDADLRLSDLGGANLRGVNPPAMQQVQVTSLENAKEKKKKMKNNTTKPLTIFSFCCILYIERLRKSRNHKEGDYEDY